MTLILQIALGMLLGYILIENRHSLLRLARGVGVLMLILAIGGIVVGGIWYLGKETITAVSDYGSAGPIGQKVFFGLGVVAFLLLAGSMFFGLWVFAFLLIPKAVVRFCGRFKRPRTPMALLTWAIVGLAFLLGSQIRPPGILAEWESAWTEWGLSHGMGYDGRSTFHLLLWQAIWAANYLLFRLRGSDPFEDEADFLGAKDGQEAIE